MITIFNKPKYIPYGKQNITSGDVRAVLSVLKSKYLTQGPLVEIFEQKISEYVNSNFAIAVNSATSALHIACLALDLQEGDILWTSPISFVASANCGLYCGAKVDFIDIDTKTGLLDISALRVKLEKAEKTNEIPKILVAVHLSGTSCQMKELRRLSIQYKFKIIEDASHAIGGSYQDKKVGSSDYSDICVFSFHPVKIITTGEGGIATTNNKEYADKMKMLRTHGITKEVGKFEEQEALPWSYEQQLLGFNYRMNELSAALGISQLKRVEKIIRTRNKLLVRYKTLLANMPLEFLEIEENVVSSVHLAMIRLNEPAHQLELYNYLQERNIGVQIHYIPIHLQPYYRRLGFRKGDFPKSEDFARSVISLPLFETLSYRDQVRVVNIIKEYFSVDR